MHNTNTDNKDNNNMTTIVFFNSGHSIPLIAIIIGEKR